MKLTPELVGTDITLVGGFRPANFSGQWLLDRGLVRTSDVDPDKTDEEKIRNEFYQIRGVTFSLVVLPDRMTVQGSASNAPVIRDLVIGLLQLNAASAVSALGLNFNAHYQCSSEKEWHDIGHFFVPKTVWSELFPGKHIGTRSVQVSVSEKDNPSSRAEISLQPSVKVLHGIFLGWNDHHDFKEDASDPEAGISWAVRTVTENYDRLTVSSYKTFADVLTHATK